MAQDLTDLVRASCRQVLERAQLVAIDPGALDSLAQELLVGLERPGQDGDAGERRRPSEGDVGLVLALDAVNFGSGWHDVVRKRPGLSGARTMAAGLRDHVARTGPLTAERLVAMSTETCAEIFGQDLRQPEQAELVGLFAGALRDLGLLVADRYRGSFLALVESAAGSAVALAELLLAMPAYRDRAQLDGQEVHLYKRAQITPADLARDIGTSPCTFADLDRLTAFADNLVPHVLRLDGVLRYDPALAAHIDAGRRLEGGSRPEVEIRAAGVHAVELVVAALAERGREVRAMDVDLILWSRGGASRYKAVPRHRARTVFY